MYSGTQVLDDHHAPIPRETGSDIAALLKADLQALMTQSHDAKERARKLKADFYTERLPNR